MSCIPRSVKTRKDSVDRKLGQSDKVVVSGKLLNMEEESHQPKRGILRNKSEDKHHSGIQWDEMNILMTYHPPDKDYGHIKINEPPTPYNKWKDPDDEEGEGTVEPFSDDEADPEKSVDPENLHDRIKDAPKRRSWEESADAGDDDPDDELSESQKALNKEFKEKRKQHYNEYSKVKLARKLIEQELKDLEDDSDSVTDTTKEGKEGPSSSESGADTQMDET